MAEPTPHKAQATIAILNKDGSVTGYNTRNVSMDPGLSTLGRKLLEDYTNKRTVRDIMFPDNRRRLYSSVSELLRDAPNEFVYIFNPVVDQWFFCCNDIMSHNPLPRLTAKHVAPGYVHREEWIRMSDSAK